MRAWMEQWWRALTRPEEAADLFRADAGARGFVRRTALFTAVAYALYGFTMGAFRGGYPAVVSGIKLPFLFLFSLLICLAPLYVMNTLFGPRLSARACLRLLVLAVSVNAVALGSYAPFSLLFTLNSSRQGYHFLVMMHVVVFALAALASLAVVAMLFRAVATARGVRWSGWFIAVWLVFYGTVGMKMAWVLRPWIGDWSQEYTPFRDLKGSFYGSVWRMVTHAEDDSETETGEPHE